MARVSGGFSAPSQFFVFPLLLNVSFQGVHIWVINLCLQNTPVAIIQRAQVWQMRWPNGILTSCSDDELKDSSVEMAPRASMLFDWKSNFHQVT
jgi:hypothetical protein